MPSLALLVHAEGVWPRRPPRSWSRVYPTRVEAIFFNHANPLRPARVVVPVVVLVFVLVLVVVTVAVAVDVVFDVFFVSR